VVFKEVNFGDQISQMLESQEIVRRSAMVATDDKKSGYSRSVRLRHHGTFNKYRRKHAPSFEMRKLTATRN